MALGLAASAAAQPAVGPKVDAPGKLPEPPPSAPELAYDARLLSSAAAAERFQGPLDGGWTLSAAGQGDLYAFQLADKRDHVEGAWRDLRRPGDRAASGVIDLARRAAGGVTLRFTPEGQAPVIIVLGPDLHGRAEQAGRVVAVALRRGGS